MVMTRHYRQQSLSGRSLPQIRVPVFPFGFMGNRDASLDVDVVLTLRNDPRYLSLVRAVTTDICCNLGLTMDVTDGVKLAIGEAVANAMEHGSSGGKDAPVTIIFAKTQDCLRVEVIDDGPGICFPINTRRCRRRNRGFGIMLMRSLMDTVDYMEVSHGTHLVMTKRLPS